MVFSSFSFFFFSLHPLGQKLLKISCLLLHSMGGGLFLLRPVRAFCLASAAVGLRRRPPSRKGSETRLSSSSGTYNRTDVQVLRSHLVFRLISFLRVFLPHLLSHLDAHVRATDLWLGGGTSWGLRCWAPAGSTFWRHLCDWGVCKCDINDRWICGGEFSGRRRGGWGAFCGWFLHIDLCERENRNTWDILSGE